MSENQSAAVPLVNIANVLTVIRVLLVPVFIWFVLADNSGYGWWRWAAVLVFVVAIYTDKLDGDLARSRGLVTNFGKIADPIADKLLIGSALVLLSLIDGLSWWITVVILVREIGITILRFIVIRYGVIAASRGGKLKTVIQTVAIFLLLLPLTHTVGSWLYFAALLIMWIAVAITVWTGVDYLVQAVRLRRGRL